MSLVGSLLSPEHALHLRSARLVLRELTMEDAPLLVELDSDPEVTKYLRPHFETTLERVRDEILPRVLGYYATSTSATGGVGLWAAHERSGGAFVGWFFLRPDRSPPHEPELGYRLRRDAWGKGYATEMSRTLLAYGFEQLGFLRTMARAEAENIRSWHVMEKLGMTRERQISDEGIAVVEYGLDRETWRRRTR
jgi:RimJ/RimL family protein N-acetyltransferase